MPKTCQSIVKNRNECTLHTAQCTIQMTCGHLWVLVILAIRFHFVCFHFRNVFVKNQLFLTSCIFIEQCKSIICTNVYDVIILIDIIKIETATFCWTAIFWIQNYTPNQPTFMHICQFEWKVNWVFKMFQLESLVFFCWLMPNNVNINIKRSFLVRISNDINLTKMQLIWMQWVVLTHCFTYILILLKSIKMWIIPILLNNVLFAQYFSVFMYGKKNLSEKVWQ